MTKLIRCGDVADTRRDDRSEEWPGFTRGMGIGGWLTNSSEFNVLPQNHRLRSRIVIWSTLTHIHEGKILRTSWDGF